MSNQITSLANNHTRVITAIAYAPEGSEFATASADGTLQRYNTVTGEVIGFRMALSSRCVITALAYSPLNPILTCGTVEGTVVQWDLNQKKAPETFSVHNKKVTALIYSDSNKIITGCENGEISVYNPALNTQVILPYQDSAITALAPIVGENSCVSGDLNGNVTHWNLGVNKFICSVKEDASIVALAATSSSAIGEVAIATSKGKVLARKLVDLIDPLYATFQQNISTVAGLAYSPDSTELIVALNEGRILSLDGYTGTINKEFSLDSRIASVAYSKDGSEFIVGTENAQLFRLNTSYRNIAQPKKPPSPRASSKYMELF